MVEHVLRPVLLLFTWLVAVTAADTDIQYYELPRLFDLDDYDSCEAAGGSYCVGTFRLRPADFGDHTSEQLFEALQKYSLGEFNFNRTVLHRGYCVTSHCTHVRGPSLARRFQRCVAENIYNQYKLHATLQQLEYCETPRMRTQPLDSVDLIFAAAVVVLLLLNVVGTAYDYIRIQNDKPNKYLIVWSLRVNWRRLTANNSGDPRLSALRALQGIKAFSLAIVMLAHSLIAFHVGYIFNPEYIEKGSAHWSSMLFHNGSVLVQTFFLLSAFLLAYNLLILADDTKQQLSIRQLPQCVVHRLIRILPLHVFVLGLTATWWPRTSSGALWRPLITAQAHACRRKWWTHVLFLNNVIYPDDKCLVPSWFLAADMQLYVVAAALTLLLVHRRRALLTLTALFLTSVAAIFLVAYYFQLKPIMLVMKPEVIRSQYAGEESFKWLYMAAWGSLPAAVLGVLLAFLQHRIHSTGYRPDSNAVFRAVYPWFLPALIVWMLCGHAVRGAGPLLAAAYAALDRAGFAVIGAVGIIGIINNVDSIWKRFFEWSGWIPLGRMSLAVLLVHWNYNLTHIAVRTQPSRVAVYELGGHWHSVEFMTYFTALPLHLCIELPAQRFLQTLLF